MVEVVVLKGCPVVARIKAVVLLGPEDLRLGPALIPGCHPAPSSGTVRHLSFRVTDKRIIQSLVPSYSRIYVELVYGSEFRSIAVRSCVYQI